MKAYCFIILAITFVISGCQSFRHQIEESEPHSIVKVNTRASSILPQSPNNTTAGDSGIVWVTEFDGVKVKHENHLQPIRVTVGRHKIKRCIKRYDIKETSYETQFISSLFSVTPPSKYKDWNVEYFADYFDSEPGITYTITADTIKVSPATIKP